MALAAPPSFLEFSSDGFLKEHNPELLGVYTKIEDVMEGQAVYKQLDGYGIIRVPLYNFYQRPVTSTPRVTGWILFREMFGLFLERWPYDNGVDPTVRFNPIENPNPVSDLPVTSGENAQNIEDAVEGTNTEIIQKIINKIDELNIDLAEQNKPLTAETKLIEQKLKEEISKLEMSKEKGLQETRTKEKTELKELKEKYSQLRKKIVDNYELKQENAQLKYVAEKKSMEEIRNATKVAIEQALHKYSTNLNKLQSNGDAELGPQVRKDMECPVCLEEMKPPTRIFQCSSGHLICSFCKDRLDGARCPSCIEANITGRNLALERLARTIYGQQ